MNKVIFLGRLTKDVEVRYTQTSNTLVATFTIAVNRRMEKDKADFFNCVAYGKTGEFISKYFKKGQQILLVGRLQTRHYTDKDSKEVYVTETFVDEVYFVGNKEEKPEAKQQDFTPVTDEDLPF